MALRRFTEGEKCNVCNQGTLKSGEPAVAYRWSGQIPIRLVIYQLARLICNSCKSTFTAQIKGENPKHSVELTGETAPRPKERIYDSSVAATVATMRFEYGVPHYRLADIQESQGVPFAPGTQIDVMRPLKDPAEAVEAELKKLGANAKRFITDDTSMRVLDMERGLIKNPNEVEKPKKVELLSPTKKNREAKGRKAITTGIVCHTNDRIIALLVTGFDAAGKNLNDLLKLRDPTLPIPIQICDGLAANRPQEFTTIMGNCLDHARRNFLDLEAYYPKDINFFLDTLAIVYANDAKAKDQNLNADERLKFHQEHSSEPMAQIEKWAREIKAGTRIEPNSKIIDAIDYLLKKWPKLTLFLRVPGVPLSSSEVERLLKKCIRHRKNSMHYKTLNGSKFGDTMMSLIQTCRYSKIATHPYLTALARFAEYVLKKPAKWLPWNYHENLVIRDSC